jgi:cell division protein FtsW
MNDTKGTSLWSWVDDFKGDKVILIITLILMTASIVSVFSSSTLLALGQHTNRASIMVTQVKTVGIGAAVILLIYFLGNSRIYRFIGKCGFILSLGMLSVLAFNLDLGLVRAGEINGASRVIVIMGKQLHVFEIVKLLMVLYVSWALTTYKEGGFRLTKHLAAFTKKLSFLDTPIYQKTIYMYVPLVLVIGLIMRGSNSSALFLAAIMVSLFVIGGIDVKDIAVLVGVLVVAIGLLFAANALGVVEINRFDTGLSRVTNDEKAQMDSLIFYMPGEGHYNAAKYHYYLDKLRQPVGAKLAIKDGGFFGKGIGNSMQKYVVPVIFSDYMFSFIIEETGILGATIVIILYYSLLARGVWVAKRCEDYFDKMAVTGLSILIAAQAFMHMMVNVHFPLIPQTGQTLPLMSHGTSSFLVFSAVLGILLSLSKKTGTDGKEEVTSLHTTQESTMHNV